MKDLSGDWCSYAGDPGSRRYRESNLQGADLLHAKTTTWTLPLEQALDQAVQSALEHGDETAQFGPNEGTPLKIGNALYTVCAPSIVAKFDLDAMAPAVRGDGSPAVFDCELQRDPAPQMIGFLHRGLTYWQKGDQQRIFLARGDAKLMALDLDLNPVSDFGTDGIVEVAPNPPPRLLTMTSPPAVCGDVVIVGTAIGDLNKDRPPARGDVYAYSAESGVLLWTFATIPCGDTIMGEPIDTDWADGSNKTSGHANVWAPMSVDTEAGLVYLPVSGAYNDAYGGKRPGNNRHAQSIVALEVKTGAIRWQYQLIRHDLWDYDPPAAPVLIDIEDKGTVHKLVVQVTKQAFAYVFDRHTGEPRWTITDCAVKQSEVPGECTAATQPIPTKPEPFDQQGLYPSAGRDLLGRPVSANINDASAQLHKEIIDVISRYEYGPLFTPPSVRTAEKRGTIQFPGFLGGASWAGAVADPARQCVYVSSITRANVSALEKNGDENDFFSLGYDSWGVRDGNRDYFLYPLLKSPWGRITAIDMVSGEHLWQQPVGDGPRAQLEAAYDDIKLEPGELGWPRRVHLLATSNVLFAAQEAHRQPVAQNETSNLLQYQLFTDKPVLRAYDPASGELLAQLDIGLNAQGALMHFTHRGREFIAVPVGGFDLPAQIVLVEFAG